MSLMRAAIPRLLALIVPVGVIIVGFAIAIGHIFGARVDDPMSAISSESGRAYIGDDRNIHLAPGMDPSELKTFIVHDGEGRETSRLMLGRTGGFLLESNGSDSRRINIDTRPGHPSIVTFQVGQTHKRLEIEIQDSGATKIDLVDSRNRINNRLSIDTEGTFTTKSITEPPNNDALSRHARPRGVEVGRSLNSVRLVPAEPQ